MIKTLMMVLLLALGGSLGAADKPLLLEGKKTLYQRVLSALFIITVAAGLVLVVVGLAGPFPYEAGLALSATASNAPIEPSSAPDPITNRVLPIASRTLPNS